MTDDEARKIASDFLKSWRTGDKSLIEKYSKEEIKMALSVLPRWDHKKTWFKAMEMEIELREHAEQSNMKFPPNEVPEIKDGFFDKLKSFRKIVMGILGFVALVIGIWVGIIKVADWRANRIVPKKIYLALKEVNDRITPLKINNQIISTLKDIKKDAPVSLQFILKQENTNAPEITKIFITFPDSAKVTAIPDISYNLDWRKTGVSKNQYVLEYPSQPPARGSEAYLPYFSVIFREIDHIDFHYTIVGNKMDPIERSFTINTAKLFNIRDTEWLISPATPCQATTSLDIFRANAEFREFEAVNQKRKDK